MVHIPLVSQAWRHQTAKRSIQPQPSIFKNILENRTQFEWKQEWNYTTTQSITADCQVFLERATFIPRPMNFAFICKEFRPMNSRIQTLLPTSQENDKKVDFDTVVCATMWIWRNDLRFMISDIFDTTWKSAQVTRYIKNKFWKCGKLPAEHNDETYAWTFHMIFATEK